MRIPKALPAIAVLLLLGCGGAGLDETGATLGIPEDIEIQFFGAPICCNPNGPWPQEIGTLRIRHIGTADSEAYDVEIGKITGGSVFPDPAVVELPDTVRMEWGEVLDTKLFAINCFWSTVQSDLRFTGTLGSRFRQRVALNNSCGTLMNLFDLVDVVLPEVDEAALLRDSVIRAIYSVAVPWSAPHVDPNIPAHLWVEINAYGTWLQRMFLDELVNAFGAIPLPKKPAGDVSSAVEFPCGAGANGFTVCSAAPQPLVEGDYVFAYFSVAEDIPLDSTRLITYGFVFDGDGDTTNNYVPHPSFPDDYFKDSDRWYTVEYAPGSGWTLYCRDATNSVIQEVPTGARAIISGNVILLVVPGSEFAVPDPSYRVTSFTHTGDYGENPPHDWSGDQHPRVSEGLGPFLRQD